MREICPSMCENRWVCAGGAKPALFKGGYVPGPRGYVRARKFTYLRGVAGDMCGDLGICAASWLDMCGGGGRVFRVLGICAGYVRAIKTRVCGKSVQICAGVPGYVRGPPCGGFWGHVQGFGGMCGQLAGYVRRGAKVFEV